MFFELSQVTPATFQGPSLLNLPQNTCWDRKPQLSAGPGAVPVAQECSSTAAWLSLCSNFWSCRVLYMSKLKYTLALKWYIEFSFKSCLRNCLPFVTTMHSPTHFFAPQSAVKHVQSSSTHCSKTVHLSKAAVSKLFTNPTGRHLVLPPAKEVSNTPLVTQGEAEVKWDNTISPLSHSKPGCSTKLLPC